MPARLRLLPVALLALLAAAVPARAEVTLVTGPAVSTTTALCFGQPVQAAYSRQGTTDPAAGDVFYLSLRLDFTSSFDCAADFVSAVATLPPGLELAVGASTPPICRRFAQGVGGTAVFDPRAQQNCPTTLALDGSRSVRLGPRDGAVLPDSTGPAGSFFFVGIRAPQESQEYPSLQLLVPVRATAALAAPVSFLTCTVGTSCVTAHVDVVVGAPPAAGATPVISLVDPIVTAVGARIPFAANVTGTASYSLRGTIATDAGFTTGFPCGLTSAGFDVRAPGNVPFTADMASEVQFGDLQAGGTPCFLVPDTTYHFRFCPVTTAVQLAACRTSTFRTGVVQSALSLPDATRTDRPSSGALTTGLTLLGGRPAGTLRVQRRPAGSGIFADAGVTLAVGEGVATFSATRAVTGLAPWRRHDLRTCYTVTATARLFCSDPVAYMAGAVYPGAPTAIGATGATVSAVPSAPHPAGTLTFRAGTTDPAGAAPDLPVVASADVAANATTVELAPIARTLDGLPPGSTVFWQACFDDPTADGVEACSAVQQLATALPAEHVVTAAPAAAIGVTRATLSGTLVGPHTAGALVLQAAATDASDLATVAELPVEAGVADVTLTHVATLLPPDRDMVYRACFHSEDLPEACSDAIRFRTLAPDTTAPVVTVAVRGAVRPGSRIRIRVTATDDRALRAVALKVNGVARRLVGGVFAFRVPRTALRVRIVATARDAAGNATTVRRSLRVRR